MNKKQKLIIIVTLLIINVYFIYSTIGYAYLGFTSPKIEGQKNAYFMGNYILAIVFLLLTIINTSLIILLLKRKIKNRGI